MSCEAEQKGRGLSISSLWESLLVGQVSLCSPTGGVGDRWMSPLLQMLKAFHLLEELVTMQGNELESLPRAVTHGHWRSWHHSWGRCPQLSCSPGGRAKGSARQLQCRIQVADARMGAADGTCRSIIFCLPWVICQRELFSTAQGTFFLV